MPIELFENLRMYNFGDGDLCISLINGYPVMTVSPLKKREEVGRLLTELMNEKIDTQECITGFQFATVESLDVMVEALGILRGQMVESIENIVKAEE